MTTERQKRRTFSPERKVAILRQHLLDHVPVSDLCDEHGLRPNQFYDWQKLFFENGAAAFQPRRNDPSRQLKDKIAALQTKLASKDEVIAEIMASHVALKKSLGAI